MDNRIGKIRRYEQFQDTLARLYPECITNEPKDGDTENKYKRQLTRTVTFQVTDKCNLACTYCYQINKGIRRMSFETAKKFIDLLISGDKGMSSYVGVENSPGIIIEFIGGEPFLEIELIEQITDYFYNKLIEEMHPWATKFCISICSNGVLYFDPRVQHYLNKYKNIISFSITIDGNKELHDSCRVFPDGSPSYDLAVAAAKDWMSKGHYMGSKITIAPGNITYLYDAIIHMVELGYNDINANCVYEEGWEAHHATELYNQLKRVSDYFIDNNLVETTFVSLFNEEFFSPMDEENNQNWCGGDGNMLSCDPDGYLYPCIRYMESSIGTDQAPLRVGDVDNGIGCNQNCKDCMKLLQSITRRSQSTDECFYCPIAEGCSWCSAYNYQVHGTPDKRATYICIMHKARALANVYFWNTYYIKNNIPKVKKNYCPDEWALSIIDYNELNSLKLLSEREVNDNEDYNWNR